VFLDIGIAQTAVAVQADGKIVVGSARPRPVRLNPNGSVDGTFDPAPNGNVTALAIQSDGRLMIGGSFTTVGGLPRIGLARLAATGPATQTLGVTADRTAVVLNRAGTSGEIAGVLFERSSDGRIWTTLGAGSRLGNTGNWQLGGLQLPASGLFYVRATMIAPSGGASSGVYETVREFNFSNPVPSTAGTPAAEPDAAVTIDTFTGLATIAPWAGSPTPAGGGGAPGSGGPGTGAGEIPAYARLADIAARGTVSAGTPLIAGFAINGNQPRLVLLRAIGPGLTPFGVDGTLPAPELRLYDDQGRLLLSNAGWGSTLGTFFAQTGAFPLAPGSDDAAAVMNLAPGSYSLHVLDRTGAGGVALAEVYDSGSLNGGASRIVNLSSRGTVIAGNGAFIGGIVIDGNIPKQVLVRGIGPGLVKFGVGGTLADPSVAIYDSQGQRLAANDNWGDVTVAASAGNNPPSVKVAAAEVGAFALEPGSNDAALTITLAPGAYTVHVSGPAGATGAALLEIYELP
ncbi:MAG: delta-60 repeat domain-containing protein, partial [Opitutaceae bacterium]